MLCMYGITNINIYKSKYKSTVNITNNPVEQYLKTLNLQWDKLKTISSWMCFITQYLILCGLRRDRLRVRVLLLTALPGFRVPLVSEHCNAHFVSYRNGVCKFNAHDIDRWCRPPLDYCFRAPLLSEGCNAHFVSYRDDVCKFNALYIDRWCRLPLDNYCSDKIFPFLNNGRNDQHPHKCTAVKSQLIVF